MAKQINYEVQVMQGGRWTIHARYPASGNDEAVNEAKQIATSKIGDVRVLRDVYDPDAGTSAEFVIYASKMASGGGDSDGGESDDGDWGGDDSDGGGDDDDDWDDDEVDDSYTPDDMYDEDNRKETKRLQKEKKRRQRELARLSNPQTTLTSLVIKLLLIILLSVGVAVASTGVAATFLDGVNLFGTRMHGPAKDNALIILFLVMFLATALMLASVLLRNANLKVSKRPPPRRARAAAAGPAKAAENTFTPQSTVDYAEESLNGDTSDPSNEDEDAASGEEADSPEAEPSDDDHDADDAAGSGDMSPHEDKQKALMMTFIKSAMEGTGQDKATMGNFDKFGVSLFLAGACETMAQNSELSDEVKEKIMIDSVQTMGFKRGHAESFAKKYEEYLVQDPGYMQMFQAGRNSMNTFFTDQSRIDKNMAVAMDEWNKPKVKEDQAGPITVLFTDIAGSTAMTQEFGDAGAQHVVRAHNRVVREALTMWNGKEVKHTGDGIMASFVKTSDSLDAAMQMQRESSEYTAQNPDKPLYLKIGINSGEPIAEDNDLFGSTVQMSARIVDKAQKEEIFVSEIVRGICAGKSYTFKNRGYYPMKGFDVDPVLYEVTWRDG